MAGKVTLTPLAQHSLHHHDGQQTGGSMLNNVHACHSSSWHGRDTATDLPSSDTSAPSIHFGCSGTAGGSAGIEQALTPPCAVQLYSSSGQGRVSPAWLVGMLACSTLHDDACQQPCWAASSAAVCARTARRWLLLPCTICARLILAPRGVQLSHPAAAMQPQ